MRSAVLGLLLLALAATAHADPDPNALVIYPRGAALYRSDAKGNGETLLAAIPARSRVRALRTDAAGGVLLVDHGGKWSWMPLDGSAKALVELPCADGPAQLASDGSSVLCRNAKQPAQSIIVQLASGKQTAVAVSPLGARLIGTGKDRRVIWADKAIWSAPAGDPSQKTQVAPEAPLRGLLPSPDGTRAVGVYLEEQQVGSPAQKAKGGELLMSFALDGIGARRKGIRAGVPVEWSHDNRWVLLQDGSAACIMRVSGGQYKCWRGYTAASIAPDGSYALLLGAQKQEKAAKKDTKKGAKKEPKKEPPLEAQPTEEPENPGEAPEPIDDVAVPPPTGPLALYRAKLDGPYTESPPMIVKLVDGAAVWISRGGGRQLPL